MARWLTLLALVACSAPRLELEKPRLLASDRTGDSAGDLEPWSPAWLVQEGERYLEDPEHRRRSMEASLRNPENLYSRTRIASYGLGDRGWDQLPVWNPRSRPLGAADRAALRQGEAPSADGVPRLWDGRRPKTPEDWIALGREVFHRFPLRADRYVSFGVGQEDDGRSFGLAVGDDGTSPGVVVFRDVDGQDRVGITCALCHAGGADLVAGRARRTLDYGALQLAHAEARGRPLRPEMAARMASWGPGRADITEDDSEDPVAIPDLWGLRHEPYLTQAATIRQVGPVSLALRQETQYLYANHHRARPPREVVWAVTMYLYSLEAPPRDVAAAPEGEAIFRDACADCHENAAGSGDPVTAERVGTDPRLSQGVARGTGVYRPSPLIRVAEAAPYFHNGSVPSLEALVDPARLDESYEGALGPGSVLGHRYGMELEEPDKEALLRYLATL